MKIKSTLVFFRFKSVLWFFVIILYCVGGKYNNIFKYFHRRPPYGLQIDVLKSSKITAEKHHKMFASIITLSVNKEWSWE